MRPVKNNISLLILFAGIVLMVIGAMSIAYPFTTYIRVVKYVGPCLLGNSLVLFISSYHYPAGSVPQRWLISKGVLDMFFALILSYNPFMTFIAFPFLAGPLIICSGLLKIVGGIFIRKATHTWPGTFFSGILFVVFGWLISRVSYGSGISILVGLFAITLGLVYLSDSIRLRNSGIKKARHRHELPVGEA